MLFSFFIHSDLWFYAHFNHKYHRAESLSVCVCVDKSLTSLGVRPWKTYNVPNLVNIYTYTYTAVGTHCGGRGWGRVASTIEYLRDCLLNLGCFHESTRIESVMSCWIDTDCILGSLFRVTPLLDCTVPFFFLDVRIAFVWTCALVNCRDGDMWIGKWWNGYLGRGGCSSNAKVEGQVRLAHLLSVDGVKLVVHGHCEDVFPQTHTTCRQGHTGTWNR